jgi:hypothetical protein
MKLVLIRDFNSTDCTLGRLHVTAPGQDFVCDTIERPWIPMPGRAVGLSASRACRRASTARAPFERDAPGHLGARESGPRRHPLRGPQPPERARAGAHPPANYARELRGCIAPGLRRAVDADGFHMVTSSRLAMLEVRRFVLPYSDEHSMEIR